jgi:hypothetical protein
MWDKVEFSDLYKFLASLGLGMIIIALCFSFFLFQVDVVKGYQIDKSTTDCLKHSVSQQEKIGYWLFDWWWIISTVIFCIGMALLIYGVIKWRERQRVLDKSQDLDLLEKEKIKKATQIDVDKKLSEDVDEIEDNEDVGLIERIGDRKVIYQAYQSIEKRVFSSLAIDDPKVRIQDNIKVNNFIYDLVIIKRLSDNQRLHKICEIKYYQKIIRYSYLFQGISSFLLAANNYERYVVAGDRRIIIEFYIIWIYSDSSQRVLLEKYRAKVIDYSRERGVEINIIVKHDSDIDSLKNDLF